MATSILPSADSPAGAAAADAPSAAANTDEPRFYLLRSDTLLGPCQALGDAVGFNPTLLRIALCASLFLNPLAIITAYFAAGGVVVIADWLFPRRSAAVTLVAAEPAAAAPLEIATAPPERDLIAA